MKKATNILESYVKTYKSVIELYEAQPNNQAVTEYSANQAKVYIQELNEAIAILNANIEANETLKTP